MSSNSTSLSHEIYSLKYPIEPDIKEIDPYTIKIYTIENPERNLTMKLTLTEIRRLIHTASKQNNNPVKFIFLEQLNNKITVGLTEIKL